MGMKKMIKQKYCRPTTETIILRTEHYLLANSSDQEESSWDNQLGKRTHFETMPDHGENTSGSTEKQNYWD